MSDGPRFRLANVGDRPVALDLMEHFNHSQGYSSDRDALSAAFLTFVSNPGLGRFWLIDAGSEGHGNAVGYLVLAFGFSFEFHGRDAFIDEFFLEDPARGRGWGAAALAFAQSEALQLGVRAIHLEVEPDNPARRLYDRSGFRGDGRHLLTLRLNGTGSP